MKVIMVNPNERAYVTDITHTLDEMQRVVGGYIEAIYPFDDPVAIICNEEGKINSLPYNRALRTPMGDMYDVICGPFFICGLTEDDFTDIPDDLIEKYMEMFEVPDKFLIFDEKDV